MSVLAVIPARGGSKGIPRKNLRELAGAPLIAHAIRAALAAKSCDRVVVSTDDDEIAAAAKQHGAEAIARPPALANDAIMPEPAVIDVLDRLKAGGYDPAVTVLLQATAPLVEAADIDGTVALVSGDGADCAFAAAPFPYFLWRREDGVVTAVNHDSRVRLPRQQLGEQLLEAGSVYAMKTGGLRRHRHRFFGRIAVYPIPRGRAVEIDDEDDIATAETLLRRRGEQV